MTSRIDKLNMLKEIIEYIPIERIDLEIWRLSNTASLAYSEHCLTGYNTFELFGKIVDACLIGWATSDVNFQKLGFNFHTSFGPIYSKDLSFSREELVKFKPCDSNIPFFYGWKAIEIFFQIENDDATFLFDPESYIDYEVDKYLFYDRIDLIIEKYS